ncbi:MAG: hypothetical protein AUI14_21665 [Actinobacteria bacterium 13_2_20CM_2_71_6]|nr:MAG: hypothetical protein AUI14_21665 [Actinobacteria bacterium 13_2_20CM_2_71_6]
MTNGTDALAAAIRAARAGDLAQLSTLVDWPLSGAPGIAGSLPLVSELDRATGVASGLAELDSAEGNLGLVAELLEPIADRLAVAREIVPAGPEVRAQVLSALQIPEIPAGLTEHQQARLAQLRERAAALRDVYVVRGDHGDQPLAMASDNGRLVLVLD